MNKLLTNPQIDEQLDTFFPREERLILVWQYEMRYEIQQSVNICPLGLRQTRETRCVARSNVHGDRIDLWRKYTAARRVELQRETATGHN